LLVVGCWLLVVGCWLLVVGHCRKVAFQSQTTHIRPKQTSVSGCPLNNVSHTGAPPPKRPGGSPVRKKKLPVGTATAGTGTGT
jgi:hypothetical protein